VSPSSRAFRGSSEESLADDAASVIACPVGYFENTRLTDKLGKLVHAL
jgi:hypothetical protein